jgi:hypothetical protein
MKESRGRKRKVWSFGRYADTPPVVVLRSRAERIDERRKAEGDAMRRRSPIICLEKEPPVVSGKSNRVTFMRLVLHSEYETEMTRCGNSS